MIGSRLYIGKILGKPGDILFKVISFNKYEQQAFKRGIYEVSVLQKLLVEENNRYGYAYNQAFIIQSGLDKDKNDKCLIILG